VSRLIDALGPGRVLTAPELVAAYATDWTGRFEGSTTVVARPTTVEEVAEVLARCHEARVAVVPQGGNTGLVGGGVPLAGELVLSLRGLQHLEPVDGVAMQVTVGAGVTIEALAAHAAEAGLAYGVDLAARASATVGGTIATNAGGLHLLRWGGTRQQLAGIEAVLADGRVVRHLHGLPKDNTGYDLAGLLCGSEGTLAVVTAARLRLVPRYPNRVVALVGMPDVGSAVEAVASWRRTVDGIDAAELFLADGLALVCDVEGRRRPFLRDWPAYVLVEASGHEDPTDTLASAVSAIDDVGDVAVAADSHGRAELWAYREAHTTAINTLGPPHKLDVSLPLDRLARFAAEVPAVVAAVAPGARTWLFGHVGDGNLHVNVTGVAPTDDRVDDAVLRLAAASGGSISAEHGIGTAKKRWLHLNRTPAELAAMAAIKRALDPVGILNPHVLLP
jgi:FAD/FMN-containing dehydrogenase